MSRLFARQRLAVVAFLFWSACGGDPVPDTLGSRSAEEQYVPLVWTTLPSVTQDSLLQRAAAAIADGRPALASRLLARRLADSSQHQPALILMAAEAAPAWCGWREVERLLHDATWLDNMARGRGHELLARAYLSYSPRTTAQDSAAAHHASRALQAAGDTRTRGVRRVLLARSFDRLQMLDSAAHSYRAAGEELSEVNDWLLLRAVAVTRDEGDRARLLAEVRSTLGRSQRLAAEADARVRLGDTAAASSAWLLAGDTMRAYRVRLASSDMPEADRAAARTWLNQLLVTQPGSAAALNAAELLVRHYAPLSSGEHLDIARSDAVGGPVGRAIQSFSAAFDMSAGTVQDRYALGVLLARAGRNLDAAAEFARVSEPRALAAAASYQRARALLRGGRASEAQRVLREVASRYDDLPDGAGQALYLLGDLASDNGRESEARDYWKRLATRFPDHAMVQSARFRAALMSYVLGDLRTAAMEWDSLAEEYPDGPERNAAQYWSGRALERLGRTADARLRWQRLMQREQRSYYAMRAAHRLKLPSWVPDNAGAEVRGDWRSHERIPRRIADQAWEQMFRAALLDELGMEPEAGLERDALYRDANALQVSRPVAVQNSEPSGAPSASPVSADTISARALAAAYAFSRAGFASRGIVLADRALALGMPFESDEWRLVYPITHRAVLVAESRRHRVEPALVAALIRQESRFTPAARSPADARGLMQILPSVGRSLARARGITPWDDVMLYQPDLNIELGVAHLAAELARDGTTPEYALAAYNAGRSRLLRWQRMRGADDPEVFVERIPFVETRDYVRIVLRNRDFYRALYSLDATDAAARGARGL